MAVDQYENILLPEGDQRLHTTYEFCIGDDRTVRKFRALTDDYYIAAYAIVAMLDLAEVIRKTENKEVLIQVWNRDVVHNYGPYLHAFDGFKLFPEQRNFLWLQQRRLEILTNGNRPLEV